MADRPTLQTRRNDPPDGRRKAVAELDLLPTIAAVTGAQLPEHPIDGHDISALLFDPQAASPHDTQGLFYYKNNRVEAVRMGKWKLCIQYRGKGPDVKTSVELYDLDTDIGEAEDVAQQHPQVVQQMRQYAESYDQRLKSNARPLWRLAAQEN